MKSNLIDVIVLTKNSERMLEPCLNSVFKNVPVNRLIVVDGYSTDRTPDIICGFQKKHNNIIIVKDGGTRGSARLKGIGLVETAWFLFVDSDVTLCDGWFSKAMSFVDKDVGAIWGIEIWDGLQDSILLGVFLQITRRIFEIRGGTHDLLVWYEAVKDIDIPKNLHVFEDAYIAEWIRGKGYRLVATYNPYCIHYRPPIVWTFKGSLDVIIESLRYGSITKMPKLLMAYGFYTFYVLYRNLFERKSNLRS